MDCRDIIYDSKTIYLSTWNFETGSGTLIDRDTFLDLKHVLVIKKNIKLILKFLRKKKCWV